MSTTLPTGVTVTGGQPIPQPTIIQVGTSDATTSLITTYLNPLLTSLGITAPSGFQVGGFNFNIFSNGKSIARINWIAVPPTPPPSS